MLTVSLEPDRTAYVIYFSILSYNSSKLGIFAFLDFRGGEPIFEVEFLEAQVSDWYKLDFSRIVQFMNFLVLDF